MLVYQRVEQKKLHGAWETSPSHCVKHGIRMYLWHLFAQYGILRDPFPMKSFNFWRQNIHWSLINIFPITIWLSNIAMEISPSFIGKPSISMGHRNPMATLVITREYQPKWPMLNGPHFRTTNRRPGTALGQGAGNGIDRPLETCHQRQCWMPLTALLLGKIVRVWAWIFGQSTVGLR